MIYYLLQVHWDWEGSRVLALFEGYPSFNQLRKAMKEQEMPKRDLLTLHKEKAVRTLHTHHDLTEITVIKGANNG